MCRVDKHASFVNHMSSYSGLNEGDAVERDSRVAVIVIDGAVAAKHLGPTHELESIGNLDGAAKVVKDFAIMASRVHIRQIVHVSANIHPARRWVLRRVRCIRTRCEYVSKLSIGAGQWANVQHVRARVPAGLSNSFDLDDDLEESFTRDASRVSTAMMAAQEL